MFAIYSWTSVGGRLLAIRSFLTERDKQKEERRRGEGREEEMEGGRG